MERMILELDIVAAKQAEFLTILKDALPATRTYAGNLCVKLWTVKNDNSKVLLYEEWASCSHQEAYAQWRVDTGFEDAIAQYVMDEKLMWLLEECGAQHDTHNRLYRPIC